jgi:uncharacterized protein (TIGR02453 family)
MTASTPKRPPTPPRTCIPRETFTFFRDLAHNNRKEWMDANRDRYRQHAVEPLREFLDALTPSILALDSRFVITGKTGVNFSRINRDIRFAKDKTPYYTRIYIIFPDSVEAEGAQLYIGIHPHAITAGFRIYGGPNVKKSPLGMIGHPRAAKNGRWLVSQKRRLGRKYESYWHSMEKGVWKKNPGWPEAPEDWARVRAWIVRREIRATVATRAGLLREVVGIFRDVAPLCRFISSPKWRP